MLNKMNLRANQERNPKILKKKNSNEHTKTHTSVEGNLFYFK